MLDGISLDQLRTFVTAVEEGSFSAAARKLRRVQSVIKPYRQQPGRADWSHIIRPLRPLSAAHAREGLALLVDARGILAGH